MVLPCAHMLCGLVSNTCSLFLWIQLDHSHTFTRPKPSWHCAWIYHDVKAVDSWQLLLGWGICIPCTHSKLVPPAVLTCTTAYRPGAVSCRT